MMFKNSCCLILAVAALLIPSMVHALPDGWCDVLWCNVDPDRANTACGGRRSLQEWEPQDMKDGVETCNNEDYSLSFLTIDHIFLMATPLPTSNQNCPPIRFEASYRVPAEGELETFVKSADMLTADILPEVDALDLGSTKPLSVIMKAYESSSASPNQDGAPAAYDIIRSNCASLPLNMMSALGIPTTQAFVEYNVRRLLMSDKLQMMILGSDHLEDLFLAGGDTNEASAEEIVTRLVGHHIAMH